MANENPKPHQPPSPTERAMRGASERLAKPATDGEGVNLVEISRQIKAVRQVVNQNGPRLNALENGVQGVHGKVSQLNTATQKSLRRLSERIDKLPCKAQGACPPAQRTTATVTTNPSVEDAAPPEAVQEIGRLDENNRAVITNPPQQGNTEVPMTTPQGRDRPVREADDDELADELLERQERRARREQRRAQLEVGLQMPRVGVSATMPNMSVKDRLRQGLDYQMQFREPWYKNKFFHTTWGFLLLFVIVLLWDHIMGWIGYTPENQPVPDQNAPSVAAPNDTTPGVSVNVQGVDAEMRAQYESWQREVNLLLDDAYSRIVLAREKVAAVRETANGGRLYPAEDEYLEDAIRLLDEASGMMIVQESEESND